MWIRPIETSWFLISHNYYRNLCTGCQKLHLVLREEWSNFYKFVVKLWLIICGGVAVTISWTLSYRTVMVFCGHYLMSPLSSLTAGIRTSIVPRVTSLVIANGRPGACGCISGAVGRSKQKFQEYIQITAADTKLSDGQLGILIKSIHGIWYWSTIEG